MEKQKKIKHISEIICNLCDESYNDGFEAGTKTTQECSWEKGVRDAWEYIKHKVDEYHEMDGYYDYPSIEMKCVQFLHDFDPVIYTKGFVEERNKEDLAKTEPIEVGDVVVDANGKERVAVHISENEFVYAINIKDGNDLLVEFPYSLKKTGEKAVIKVFKPLAVGELK